MEIKAAAFYKKVADSMHCILAERCGKTFCGKVLMKVAQHQEPDPKYLCAKHFKKGQL